MLSGEWPSVCAWGVHLLALGWMAYGFSHSAYLVGYGAHVEAVFELGGLGVQGARLDSSISVYGIHLLCWCVEGSGPGGGSIMCLVLTGLVQTSEGRCWSRVH